MKTDSSAAEIVRHLVDPDYLLSHDLILLGSPATVVKKLKAWATAGMFNTFFGEFNFGDLADEVPAQFSFRDYIPRLLDHDELPVSAEDRQHARWYADQTIAEVRRVLFPIRGLD